MDSYSLGSHTVGRVGFGAMQLPGPGVFGPPRDHDQAIAVLKRVIELGIDHIDTAQFYGPNVANELIREALHPYPADLTLVSKVGGKRDDQGNWLAAQQPDELRRGIEENLKTLDVDKLAAVNLRVFGGNDDPSAPAEVDRELFDAQLTAMIAARDEGLIDGIGLSSIGIDHLRIALERTEIVCVQNAYNLVDRTSQPVLDLCDHEDDTPLPSVGRDLSPRTKGVLGAMNARATNHFWLEAAKAHAETRKFPADNYLGLRLAPDMLPFTKQIQIASDARSEPDSGSE